MRWPMEVREERKWACGGASCGEKWVFDRSMVVMSI